jgi:hypothetical protein
MHGPEGKGKSWLKDEKFVRRGERAWNCRMCNFSRSSRDDGRIIELLSKTLAGSSLKKFAPLRTVFATLHRVRQKGIGVLARFLIEGPVFAKIKRKAAKSS